MDVDEGSSMLSDRTARMETLFARSEEMSVAFYANLPVEVKQVLKNASKYVRAPGNALMSLTYAQDFYADSYSGDVDTVTGFALVASSRTCFVWQHAQVC
jgi:nuclear pore complex protein Nup133